MFNIEWMKCHILIRQEIIPSLFHTYQLIEIKCQQVSYSRIMTITSMEEDVTVSTNRDRRIFISLHREVSSDGISLFSKVKSLKFSLFSKVFHGISLFSKVFRETEALEKTLEISKNVKTF
jgi:hypothetical protein